MIEFLIVLSTMCPSSFNGDHCYEKMAISRADNGKSYSILSSTTVSQCEIEGHRWKQGPSHFYPEYIAPGDWRCRVCGINRKYKQVKREIYDSFPDDGPLDKVENSNNLFEGIPQ